MWVQWPLQVHPLTGLRASTHDLQVVGDGPAPVVGKFAGSRVADPGVRTTTTRIDPHDVLETKVLAQRGIHDFDCHRDECPAFRADVSFRTASADVVVICQINIENQLFRQRFHLTAPKRFPVSRIRTVDGADLETGRVHLQDIFAEASEDPLSVVLD